MSAYLYPDGQQEISLHVKCINTLNIPKFQYIKHLDIIQKISLFIFNIDTSHEIEWDFILEEQKI